MSAFTRMRRGWHLGFQSLRIVFRDKTLLFFPGAPITIAIAIIVSFCLMVGPDQLFWALFVVNSLQHARYLAVGYGLVAVVSVFFSVGLVACTRITLDERDSKLADGFLAALKKLHWVVIWAFISWTIGPLLNLLDHQRHTSGWVRKILKTSWSLLSYFVVPILIVDRINIFSALRRSVKVMSKTWGEGAVSQLGLMWFFWLMNIPTLLLFGYGHYLEGPWPKSLTFVVLAMVYGTIVIYQTASAVLSVVLYKYALDGTVVKGFKEEWMKEAFVRPKVYVLVDEVPVEGYEPVGDVPAPDGVEPVAEPEEQPESGDEPSEEVEEQPKESADGDTGISGADGEEAAPEVDTSDPDTTRNPE